MESLADTHPVRRWENICNTDMGQNSFTFLPKNRNSTIQNAGNICPINRDTDVFRESIYEGPDSSCEGSLNILLTKQEPMKMVGYSQNKKKILKTNTKHCVIMKHITLQEMKAQTMKYLVHTKVRMKVLIWKQSVL